MANETGCFGDRGKDEMLMKESGMTILSSRGAAKGGLPQNHLAPSSPEGDAARVMATGDGRVYKPVQYALESERRKSEERVEGWGVVVLVVLRDGRNIVCSVCAPALNPQARNHCRDGSRSALPRRD